MNRTRSLTVGVGTASLLLVVAAVLALLWTQGWRAYAVTSGSMEPQYHPGDLVLDRPASAGYGPGDVLTFQPTEGVRITHRLTGIDEGGLRTKGDANPEEDAWVLPAENVDGVVAGRLPHLGYVAVFFQQPAGVAGLISTVLSALLLHGLFFPSAPAVGATPAARPSRRSKPAPA